VEDIGMIEEKNDQYINRHTDERATVLEIENGVASLALETGPDRGWVIDIAAPELAAHWWRQGG
jgi:hypothetical protein